jgi:membrane-bound lytic murein transglycosylase C
MKYLLISISVLIALNSSVTFSQELPVKDDPFAELDKEINSLNNEGSPSDIKEFQQWKSEYLLEYQNFRKEHFKRVDDVRDDLISLWGESDTSSPSKYVEYSKDKKTKTTLDFENNELTISVLHDENREVSQKFVIDSLNNMAESSSNNASLSQIVGQPLTKTSAESLVKSAKIEHKKSALIKNKKALIAKEIKLIEEQSQAQLSQVEKMYDLVNVDTPDNKKMAEETENSIKKEKAQIEKEKQVRIASLQVQTAKFNKTEKRKALKRKKITTYTIPLGNKKALTKAKPYIRNVKVQSDRWELSPSLLLAIMHTESYFNPKAQSHVPAFGLMQIVPRSAGIDVNRFLYKKDAPMTESYLFQSENNIETGVAYMHILNSRYLQKVTNPESRMYCMIAAYNTGSGNVAKTFNKDGSRNISKAAKIINLLSPKEVYDHLVANLPYDETKDYLKRVTKRKNIYTSIDSI